MQIVNNRLKFGNGFTVTFHRTLRIPEDGKNHGLPASLGSFPVKRVEDYADRVPASWRKHGGVFIPMFQREALWLQFNADEPCAVKVAAGKINAISGKPWTPELRDAEGRCAGKNPVQDYCVCHSGTQDWNGTSQPWLDGFNTSEGTVRQFVAMPLGGGYTVEGQVTGEETVGGIQMLVIPPKPGAIQRKPQPVYRGWASRGGGLETMGAMKGGQAFYSHNISGEETFGGGLDYERSATRSMTKGGQQTNSGVRRSTVRSAEMGLAAGGTLTQKIYETEYDTSVWDQENGERVFIHIVNSEMYREITGEYPPPSPVTKQEYTRMGYAWYSIYDEHTDAVQGSGTLANVKSISEVDAEKSHGGLCATSPGQFKSKNVVVHDGKW